MKAYHNSVVLRNDGIDPSTLEADLNAGITVLVTVRIASSPTPGEGALATIFDLDEVGTANPLTTTTNGNYAFKAADDIYDIIIKEDTADEYIIAKVEIVEFSNPTLSDLFIPYEFATVAAMAASILVFPLNKTLITKGELSIDDGNGARFLTVAPSAAENKDVILQDANISRMQGQAHRDRQTIFIDGNAPKSKPAISIVGGEDVAIWINEFARNFSISDGGGALNNAASGTKDGNNNLLIGFNVMPIATTSFACAVAGFNAGQAVTTADSLTAFGYQSAFKLTTGSNNSFFGTDCGFTMETSANNSLFGRHIGFDGAADWTGGNNAVFGMDNCLAATTLNAMSIVGIFAQQDGTISARSFVGGHTAAQKTSQVDDSVIIGNGAAKEIATTALKTIEIGARTNENALSVDRNAIVGYNAFFTLSQGLLATTFNAALGSQTGLNVYGSNNTYIGNRAGAQAALAERNGQVLIGYRAGDGHASDNDLIIANTNSVANALINGNFTSRVLQLEATALTMKNIPTVGTGASGTIWSDSGTLKVVP